VIAIRRRQFAATIRTFGQFASSRPRMRDDNHRVGNRCAKVSVRCIRPSWVEWEGGVVIDSVSFAVANLLLILLGLVISFARDGARNRSEAGRASSWRHHGLKAIWVTNEARGRWPSR